MREMTVIINDSNLITYTLSDVKNLDQNLLSLRFTQAYTLLNDNLVLLLNTKLVEYLLSICLNINYQFEIFFAKRFTFGKKYSK